MILMNLQKLYLITAWYIKDRDTYNAIIKSYSYKNSIPGSEGYILQSTDVKMTPKKTNNYREAFGNKIFWSIWKQNLNQLVSTQK